MLAVVMSGGEGSRLRPLTLTRPKPMLPLVNRVVMGHIAELLRRHGISDLVATLQYRAEDIQNYFGDGSSFGVNLAYSIEPRPLGTAGSIKHAERFLRAGSAQNHGEPFLVLSGDALTDFDLSAIVAFHKRVGALVTLTLTHVSNPRELGVVQLGTDGRVSRFIEKPSWGDLISDTVNTGIYVLSPEVLDEIDPHASPTGQVDFSRDLFPRLLARGAPLYGYVAQGYWTDIGTFEEYHRATADLLAGKLDLGQIGTRRTDGIYVEEEAEIADDAELIPPVYVGRGARIRSGAVIQGPSVIRPNVVVDERAHIDRSIIWQSAYIGQDAELRGAIVASRASIGARAVVFEGAVIAEQCSIGEGAVIHPNVKIYPQKRVEAGATLRSSLIWGAQARHALFGRFGVSGRVNVDLTPELAARLGAAFGSSLPRGSTVIVNRDPHRSPRMIKRALIAGLPSAGINVMDIKTEPIPVARYYIRATNAAGGIHVRLSPFDPQTVDIRFFAPNGLNLSKERERAVESIYFREEFRRVFLDEIGVIADLPGVAAQRYADDFCKFVNADAIANARPLIVVDYAFGPAALVLPHLLDRLGVNVLALNDRLDERKISLRSEEFHAALEMLTKITKAVGAQFGVRIDIGGERIWLVDAYGHMLSGITAAAVMTKLALCAHPKPGATIVLPPSQPNLFQALAASCGARAVLVKNEHQALMEAALEPGVQLAFSGAGDFIFPEFQPVIDGQMAIAKLLEFLALQQTSVHEVVQSLPRYHIAHLRAEIAWQAKGAVMRLLGEQYQTRLVANVDGVKFALDDGEWVLIVPDPDTPHFHIFVEAADDITAHALADKYKRIVEQMPRGVVPE